MDWGDYLRDVLGSTKLNLAGDEIIAKECPFCGNTNWKFYVNPGKRVFNCYKDKRCGAHGDIIGLIMQVEQLPTRADVFRFIKSNFIKRTSTVDTLVKLMSALGMEKQEAPKPVVTPLPDGFRPCYRKGVWRVPRYAKSRGITREQIKAHGIGYCEYGRYAHRMIVPIRCAGSSSFVARDMGDSATQKYLNPPDVSSGRLIFNYDRLPKGTTVVAVEGVTDVLNLERLGYNAGGLLGKKIRWAQVELVVRLEPTVVYLMLDPDARRETVDVASILSTVVDTRVCLLEGGDPGDMTLNDVIKAMRGASAPTAMDAVSQRLAEVKECDWYS